MRENLVVECPCGEMYDGGAKTECSICGESSRKARLVSASFVPRTQSQSLSASAVRSSFGAAGSADSRSVAQQAKSQAQSLSSIAAVIAVLGVIGGIVVGVAGLLFIGDEATRPIGILLIGAGIAGVLFWVFIGAFAQTVAEGVRVLSALLQRD
jgi:hypothetical protein